eukprot:scaffold443_cov125-Cylindrotheca_fusiformis.AAC.40
MKRIRIADLLGPDTRPLQKLKREDKTEQPQPPKTDAEEHNNMEKKSGAGSTGAMKFPDASTLVSMKSFLESYLKRVVSTREDIDDNLMVSLRQLQDGAATDRIKCIATSGQLPKTQSGEADTVWLPTGAQKSTSNTTRQEQDEARHALQQIFPLLHFDETTRNDSEIWTRATIDGSFDELIPYLYRPEEDLKSLLLLRKTIEAATEPEAKSTAEIVLRLRPGIPKAERKQLFDLMLSKCPMFATKTLLEYPLHKGDDSGTTTPPETTVAIVVSRKNDDSPLAFLRSYVQRIASTHQDMDADIVSSLNELHDFALGRIRTVASGAVVQPNDSHIVWIPPPSDSDSSSEKAREERGNLFQALKATFPLLQPDGTVKNEDEKWIRVSVDVSYDEILPYLLYPVEDLSSLLLFQKQGIDGFKEKKKLRKEISKGQKRGHQDGRNSVDEAKQVILRLKPQVTKEERRKIHNLIASNCKMFATSTVSDYPLLLSEENGDSKDAATTTALAVGWQSRALQRGGRKRKRNEGNESKTTFKLEPPNLLCVVKKRQKEHLAMVQRLTQTIRCRQADIGIAGIKDMQAVTYQFCTLRDIKTHRVLSMLPKLESHGIEIGNCYRVHWALNNGDLDGNDFEIRIRNLRRIRVTAMEGQPAQESIIACEPGHIRSMVERIQKHGFINFFGSQRVGAPGETGATAFLIGKAMLQQQYQLAIDILMEGRAVFHREGEQEKESARRVRQVWKQTGDPSAALQAMGAGDFMSRERAVLKGLNRYGKDQPLQAIQCLSYSMRSFWINAYQSYVWNQVASRRIEKYGTRAVKGDLYVEKEDAGLSNVKVVPDENLASKLSLDQLVLPLPGYRVRYPENDIGQLYHSILSEDGVKFEKSAPPEATAKGAYRRFIVHPGSIEAVVENGDVANVKLKFQLPKGSYATMLLRELMMTTATRHHG